jgi:hypothetical protein
MSTTKTFRMIFGECDCCAKPNRVLHRGEVTGIETYACAECRGSSLSDEIDDLEDEIERCVQARPESGEQWAHIAALEGALLEAKGAAA